MKEYEINIDGYGKVIRERPTKKHNFRLGDKIKVVTDILHIPQCDGCKDRQEKLNNLF